MKTSSFSFFIPDFADLHASDYLAWFSYLFKRFTVSDVIHNDYAMGSTEVDFVQTFEPLLTCCVPKVNSDHTAFYLNKKSYQNLFLTVQCEIFEKLQQEIVA